MYEHFCGSTSPQEVSELNNNQIWPKKFDKKELPEGRWTPAQVTQILVQNICDPLTGLHKLINEEPTTTF